jgi:hypothetical protein
MAKKNIPSIRNGDDYRLQIQYAVVTNIAGYKFWLTLKKDFADTDEAAVLHVSTVAGQYPMDDPVNGICYLYIPSEVTAALPAGSYYYDLQVKSTANEITTILPPIDDYRARVFVIPQVTRAKS